MPDFTLIQLKRDSMGWRKELILVDTVSPDSSVSYFFFLRGVTMRILCTAASSSAHSASMYARSANSVPLETGAQSKNICLAAHKSHREADEICMEQGTGNLWGRSPPTICNLTPKYHSLRVGLRHKWQRPWATFPRLLRECFASMIGQESIT